MLQLVDELDLTQILGVEKYELPIPACLSGKIEGHFPSFLQKSDQERVQNIDINEIFNHSYYITSKLDGSSATFYFRKSPFGKFQENHYGVCSRNLELRRDECSDRQNTFYRVSDEIGLEEILTKYTNEHFIDSLSLQGELIGEGIQGNPHKIKGHSVRFFDAFIDGKKISYREFFELMNELDLSTVPVLDMNFSFEPEIDLETVLSMAEGKDLFSGGEREGIVFRANDDSNFSFKAISNKYLLKQED